MTRQGGEGGKVVELLRKDGETKLITERKKERKKNLPGFVGVPPLDSFPVTVSSRVSFVLSRIPMSRL